MKPKRDLSLERRKKRVCPKCEGEIIALGVDHDFVLRCKCKKCCYEFAGHEAKVVSE